MKRVILGVVLASLPVAAFVTGVVACNGADECASSTCPPSPVAFDAAIATLDAGAPGQDAGSCSSANTSCCRYYFLFFGGKASCSSCARTNVDSCVPIQSTQTGCTPSTLTSCEQQCTYNDCDCIQRCVGDCAKVTNDYWACLDQTCNACDKE